MSILRQLFLVSRPISWLNTAYPFAAGYILMQPTVDTLFLLGTLFFLIPYNLLMYGVNDVFDYESDIRNPRKGGIEGAQSAKKLHGPILWSSSISTLAFLVPLLWLSNLTAAVTLLVSVFFVLAYSVPVLRFKERPFLDSVTSSVHFVSPLVYALTLTTLEPSAWPIIAAFFLWGMASHAFGAVQDINPDRSSGIASIATVLGAKQTVRFSFVLYLASSLVLILTSPLAAVAGIVGLIYALNVMPYLSLSDKNAEASNRAWRRFIFLNMATGFIVTMVLIYTYMS